MKTHTATKKTAQTELNPVILDPSGVQLSSDPASLAAHRLLQSPLQCVQKNGRPLQPADPMPCPRVCGETRGEKPLSTQLPLPPLATEQTQSNLASLKPSQPGTNPTG